MVSLYDKGRCLSQLEAAIVQLREADLLLRDDGGLADDGRECRRLLHAALGQVEGAWASFLKLQRSLRSA